MGRGQEITNETRDAILMASVIYRKTPNQIAKEIGVSYDTVSRTILCYEIVKAGKWDTLAAKCNSRILTPAYLAWAEKATQTKIPQDEWDICFPKEEVEKTPERPKAPDAVLEQLVKIHAVLSAIEADLPQILTALTYLSKTFKEVTNANADPMMQMLKTANENLVGIKCNTRKLNGER